MKLRAGDWVEVRSKEEILATLDQNGRLAGLPFMPQMFKYCGQQFQVYKRAHKTCDTVSGNNVGRLLPNGIHLDLRCDGQAYDGCQAACLIFWKEAWLKPVAQRAPDKAETLRVQAEPNSHCTEADVLRATRSSGPGESDNVRYACQATELLNYTQPLKWWDARHYVEDFESGNVSLGKMASVFVYFAYYYGALANRRTFGRPARWFYDLIRPIWRGVPFPRTRGKLSSGTPTIDLNLKPGDLVRVKSLDEILVTIDTSNFNRGLYFDAEMFPSCGKSYRVVTRIERFIDEKTGLMRKLKTPAVILDGAYCQSRYSDNRLFCPRSIYTWWREVWLEKIEDGAGPQDGPDEPSPTKRTGAPSPFTMANEPRT